MTDAARNGGRGTEKQSPDGAAGILRHVLRVPFLRNVALVVTAAATVFPAYFFLFEKSAYRDLLVETVEEESSSSVRHCGLELFYGVDEITPEIVTPAMRKMVDGYLADFSLRKMRVFTADGEVVFSTEPDEVGSVNDRPYFKEMIETQELYSKFVGHDEETREGRRETHDVVEIYVPVVRGDRAIGAFEVYQDVSPRAAGYTALMSRVSWVLFALGTVFLGGAFAVLFKAGAADLRRRRAEAALQEAHDLLERRIEERTARLADANEELSNRVREIEEARRALHESEEKFRSISDSAQDAVVMMDGGGRVSYWNRAAEAMFGYRGRETIGRDLHDLLVPPAAREAFLRRFPAFLETGEGPVVGRTTRMTALRAGGEEFPVELSLSSVRIGEVWYAIGIVRDVTERERARKEQEELEGRFRQAAKMEAIGTLAGGIAHDFNNILTAILGYAELAVRKAPAGSIMRRYLDEVETAGERARDLVAQILAFSRRSEEVRGPLEITPVLKEAMKLLRATIPSTVEIREEIAASPAVVESDPTRIHQIVMNLCTNAAHAMRERGGTLTVSLAPAGEPPPAAGLEPGEYLLLSVGDTGAGIPPDLLGRIFDPYFTTKKKGEGTGLGLATVHGIVGEMGGAVDVESRPGEGTIFRIYLPRAVPAATGRAAEERGEPLPRGTERVLVVDDEPQLAQLLREMLEMLGYRVEVRTSGVEALEYIRADPGHLDLVISDVTMPHLRGDRLAEKVGALRPDLPVILCSGFSEVVDEERARRIGVRRYLMKPLVLTQVARAVREAIEQGDGS